LNSSAQEACLADVELWELPDGACVELDEGAAIDGMRFAHRTTDLDLDSISCEPTLTQDHPEPEWGVESFACAGESGQPGCGETEVCVPRLPSDFGIGPCIYKEGDEACPAGSSYAERHLAFDSISDSRTCTDCSCDVNAVECGGSISVIDGESCDGAAFLLDELAAGECSADVLDGARLARYDNEPHGCEAQEVELVGEVTPLAPITYCCL
jgi:hypothetical protein